MQVDLTRTPGAYYVIAYFLSSCLYIAVNPKRFHGWKRVLVQGASCWCWGPSCSGPTVWT